MTAVHTLNSRTLKDGLYTIRLVRISVDATPAVMLSPAVAMAAEVHCQRPPVGPASTEDSNQANSI